MKKILTKKGFTLIELIVVIAILAILAAILIPSLIGYLDRANIAKNQANARSLYSEYTLALVVTPKTDPANPILAVPAADGGCSITYDEATFAAATEVTQIVCGAGDTIFTFTP